MEAMQPLSGAARCLMTHIFLFADNPQDLQELEKIAESLTKS
jgi:hypothetical protein